MVELDRAVVLRQPWATRVVRGELRGLLRGSTTTTRGTVGVLASGGWDKDSGTDPDAYPRTVLVGRVDIKDCIPVRGDKLEFLAKVLGPAEAALYPAHFVPKYGAGNLWVLANPVEFSPPMEVATKVNMIWSRFKPIETAGHER